ncbi:MAG: HEAT repeat domain-containing protein, partial [Candidatus Thorarchaeota archaeon]
MSLTPEAIFNDFKNEYLDKSSAIDLLISLIENVDNINIRLNCIDILGRIELKDKKVFNILENLLIADSNEDIRCQAARVLKNLFLEQSISLLKWAFQNDQSLKCSIFIISLLGELKNNKARNFLLKKVQELKQKKYKNKNFLQGFLIEKLSNTELAEILINNSVISFLKIKFGYLNYEVNQIGLIHKLDLSNVDCQGLGYNRLEKALESVLSLQSLIELNLSNNHLKSLPKEILGANNLGVLDLSFNNLSSLPESISKFRMLRFLNLKSNDLKFLPDSLSRLTKLELLILRDNALTEIFPSICNLNHLKV